MTKQERFLQLLLRIFGSTMLLAVFFIMIPYPWMNAIHQWLGMGQLPDEPIVGYLARSTSAFYALFGGLLWVLSWDLSRHRLVLCYLGAVSILFGLALFGVDLLEGMPRYWSLFEGPIGVACGILILYLSYRVGRQTD